MRRSTFSPLTKFWKRRRVKRRWLVWFKRWISQVLGNLLNCRHFPPPCVLLGLNESVQRIHLTVTTSSRIPFLFLRRGKRGKRRAQRPPIPRIRWESCPWWTLRPARPSRTPLGTVQLDSVQILSKACSTNLCVELSTRWITKRSKSQFTDFLENTKISWSFCGDFLDFLAILRLLALVFSFFFPFSTFFYFFANIIFELPFQS